MNRLFYAALCLLIIAVVGCSSTFLVSKDGKGYFLGSRSDAIYRMLCDSGDLKKVLSDTRLAEEMKDDLYRYSCSTERSGDRIKKIYAAMTMEQRKELRGAFTKNGYDINYLPC